jgi:hypothetical protein
MTIQVAIFTPSRAADVSKYTTTLRGRKPSHRSLSRVFRLRWGPGSWAFAACAGHCTDSRLQLASWPADDAPRALL